MTQTNAAVGAALSATRFRGYAGKTPLSNQFTRGVHPVATRRETAGVFSAMPSGRPCASESVHLFYMSHPLNNFPEQNITIPGRSSCLVVASNCMAYFIIGAECKTPRCKGTWSERISIEPPLTLPKWLEEFQPRRVTCSSCRQSHEYSWNDLSVIPAVAPD